MRNKILIIKHGALGDWILATGAFKLIREHHPSAYISLLTNAQYSSLAKQCHWFDEVMVDNRRGLLKTFKLLFNLRKQKFDCIYDLQRSQRTALYYWLLKTPQLFWSGHVKRCNGYFIDAPEKHILERITLQLLASNINHFPKPDISWLKADIPTIKPPEAYVLIIPGCSKHRLQKKWTVSGYVECIHWFKHHGFQSVLIGTEIDREIIDSIKRASVIVSPISSLRDCEAIQGSEHCYRDYFVPRKAEETMTEGINIIGHSTGIHSVYNRTLGELAELARGATLILGGDTGPMHIAGLTGLPCLVLFCSNDSDVAKCKPWGAQVRTIDVPDLNQLPATSVIEIADQLIRSQL